MFGLLQSKTRIQTFIGGILLASLIVGYLCISFVHITHADMGAMHTMHHKSQTTALNDCCDTGTSNHMELWKSTLTGIPQDFQDALALIVIGIAAAFVFSDFFATARLSPNLLFLRYKQYAKAHPNIRAFDALRLAFAQGILNPKLY